MELDDDLDVQIVENDDVDIQIIENDELESSTVVKQETVKQTNPVEEHILKQLIHAKTQVEQAKSSIQEIQNVTDIILKSLATRAAYRENVSSDSDNDLYTSTGQPIIKKRKNRVHEKRQVLKVLEVWQRIIDDKWIIGVLVESNTTCTLKEPTIYVCPKEGEIDRNYGISAFWALVNDAYWYPIDTIEGKDQLVATAVLPMPKFDDVSKVVAQGTIFCEFDDKLFQTPIPDLSLQAKKILDYSLNFDDDDLVQYNVLALKTISVDKLMLLPIAPDSSTGKRLTKFLERYEFKEVGKFCLVKDASALQYCLLEFLPTDEEDPELRILISARSEAQLSLVVRLMRENFEEILDVERQQALEEAAEALKKELLLYLNCNDVAELQRARIKTDLLIP